MYYLEKIYLWKESCSLLFLLAIGFKEKYLRSLKTLQFHEFFPKFKALCRREQGHIPGSRCCGGGELLLSLGLGGVGGLWGYSA